MKDENPHTERRIMNGEIITTQSYQAVDGLEDSNSKIPLLWEVILIFLIFIFIIITITILKLIIFI